MLIVLGDKANHVAALHLPQMLYIWPFITFFSWPLVYPHVIAAFVPSKMLPARIHDYRPKYPRTHGKRIGPSDREIVIFVRCLLVTMTTAIAMLVVRYNTIVHPFTLADNRHYVFYVFRLLLRHPAIRYLAAPIYVICGWSAVQALCKPCAPPAPSSPIADSVVDHILIEPQAHWEQDDYAPRDPDTTMASYVLAWLLTTALTLTTAPLVEPRYFILPWITWRLAVPSPHSKTEKETGDEIEVLQERIRSEKEFWKVVQQYDGHKAVNGQTSSIAGKKRHEIETLETHSRARKRSKAKLSSCDRESTPKHADQHDAAQPGRRREAGFTALLSHGDHRLWLETAWFLLINAVTGYVFLYRGFEWLQEPGKIQRFMW